MRIQNALMIGALLIPCQSQAQSTIIEDLPPGYCDGDTDDWNSRVDRSDNQTGDAQGCVLVFLPEDVSLGRKFESEAIVQIKDKTVPLITTRAHTAAGKRKNRKIPSLGNVTRYMLKSADGMTTVELDVRVTSSSCEVYTESCCGDSFEGKMNVVTTGEVEIETSTIDISYYRGG